MWVLLQAVGYFRAFDAQVHKNAALYPTDLTTQISRASLTRFATCNISTIQLRPGEALILRKAEVHRNYHNAIGRSAASWDRFQGDAEGCYH